MKDLVLEQQCTARGIRLTRPRRVVLAALQSSRDHPDAQELHKRVRQIDPKISAATVYRLLSILEKARIIARHDFGDGRARYEPTGREGHDHIVNLDTGEVIEFRDPVLDSLKLSIAKRYNVTLEGRRLELFVRSRNG